jgi:preprotein translocase subunit SecY
VFFAASEVMGKAVEKKINQITRWLTIGITLVQGQLTSIIYIERYLVNAFYWVSIHLNFISSVVILVTGTIFAMWLEKRLQIKELGMVSLLIMVGF